MVSYPSDVVGRVRHLIRSNALSPQVEVLNIAQLFVNRHDKCLMDVCLHAICEQIVFENLGLQ